MARTIADAQHEAAHVVVGVSLGLTLSHASASNQPNGDLGATVFWADVNDRMAVLMMYAAGLAWERRVGDVQHALGDVAILRSKGVRTTRALQILERAAWAILETRGALHARITRALLEDDLDHAEVMRAVGAREAED